MLLGLKADVNGRADDLHPRSPLVAAAGTCNPDVLAYAGACGVTQCGTSPSVGTSSAPSLTVFHFSLSAFLHCLEVFVSGILL